MEVNFLGFFYVLTFVVSLKLKMGHSKNCIWWGKRDWGNNYCWLRILYGLFI